MAMKRCILDPEYDEISSTPCKKKKVIEDHQSVTKKKIASILKEHFDQDIQKRKNDVEKFDDVLHECRRKLDRLRACIITKYYAMSSLNKQCFLEKRSKRLKAIGGLHESYKETETSSINPVLKLYPNTDLKELPSGNDLTTIKTEEAVLTSNLPLSVDNNDSGLPGKNVNSNNSNLLGIRCKMQLQIVYGNVSKFIPLVNRKDNEQLTHLWKAYVREGKGCPKLSSYVKKVTFLLHPSFRPNDVVEVSQYPFELTKRGWGDFPLRIQIHFLDSRNKPIDFIHYLKLDKTCTGLTTLGPEIHANIYLYSSDDVHYSELSTKFSSEEQKSKISICCDTNETSEDKFQFIKSEIPAIEASHSVINHSHLSLETLGSTSISNHSVSKLTTLTDLLSNYNELHLQNASYALNNSDNVASRKSKLQTGTQNILHNQLKNSNVPCNNINLLQQELASSLLTTGSNSNSILNDVTSTVHDDAVSMKNKLLNELPIISDPFVTSAVKELNSSTFIGNVTAKKEDSCKSSYINNLSNVDKNNAVLNKIEIPRVLSHIVNDLNKVQNLNPVVNINEGNSNINQINELHIPAQNNDHRTIYLNSMPVLGSEDRQITHENNRSKSADCGDSHPLEYSSNIISNSKSQCVNDHLTTSNYFSNENLIKNNLTKQSFGVTSHSDTDVSRNTSVSAYSDKIFTVKKELENILENTPSQFNTNIVQVPQGSIKTPIQFTIAANAFLAGKQLSETSEVDLRKLHPFAHSEHIDLIKNKIEKETLNAVNGIGKPKESSDFLQSTKRSDGMELKELINLSNQVANNKGNNYSIVHVNSTLLKDKEVGESSHSLNVIVKNNVKPTNTGNIRLANETNDSMHLMNNIATSIQNYLNPQLSSDAKDSAKSSQFDCTVLNKKEPTRESFYVIKHTDTPLRKNLINTICTDSTPQMNKQDEKLQSCVNRLNPTLQNSLNSSFKCNNFLIRKGNCNETPKIVIPHQNASVLHLNSTVCSSESNLIKQNAVTDPHFIRNNSDPAACNLNSSPHYVNIVVPKKEPISGHTDVSTQNNLTSPLCINTNFIKKDWCKTLSAIQSLPKHLNSSLHSKLINPMKKSPSDSLPTVNKYVSFKSNITTCVQSNKSDVVKLEPLTVTCHAEIPSVNNFSPPSNPNSVLLIKKDITSNSHTVNQTEVTVNDVRLPFHSNSMPLIKRKTEKSAVVGYFEQGNVKNLTSIPRKLPNNQSEHTRKKNISRPTIVNPTVTANSTTVNNFSMNNQRLKGGVTAFVKCTDSQGRTLLVPQTSLICISPNSDSSKVSSSNNDNHISQSKSQISPNFSIITTKQPDAKLTNSNLPLYILKPSVTQQNGMNQILLISANEGNKFVGTLANKGMKPLVKSVNGVSVKKNKNSIVVNGNPVKQKLNIHWERAVQEIRANDCQSFVQLLKRVLKVLLHIKQNAGKLPFAFHALEEENKSWSIGKRRAAEWLFAGMCRNTVSKILQDHPNTTLKTSLWTKKHIMLYCRTHGYTYSKTSKIQPKLFDRSVISKGTLCEPNDIIELITHANILSSEIDSNEDIDVCFSSEIDNKTETHHFPLINVPHTSQATLFVKEAASQLSVNIKPLEMEPSIMIPVIEEMLLAACKEFVSDLLRISLNAGYNRLGGKSCPDEITVFDVYSAIVENDNFEFLTNKYLAVLNNHSAQM